MGVLYTNFAALKLSPDSDALKCRNSGSVAETAVYGCDDDRPRDVCGIVKMDSLLGILHRGSE